MWIAFSLSAAFFFALVHVLDEFCVGEVFEKPWFGVITSSIASIIVFQLIPFVAPFTDMTLPSWPIILMAIAAGVLIQLSQAIYFKALSFTEAGTVAAYLNMIPAILPIVTFFILGVTITLREASGIAILIGASVMICFLDSNLTTRWKSFFHIFLVCILQVAAYALEEYLFERTNFIWGFIFITTGIIATGLLPLLFKKVRIDLHRNARKLSGLAKFFIAIEIVNLLALFSAQRGIDLGKAPLVAAVETTVPALTFIISLVFIWALGRKHKHEKLHFKLPLIGVMVVGVLLIT